MPELVSFGVAGVTLKFHSEMCDCVSQKNSYTKLFQVLKWPQTYFIRVSINFVPDVLFVYTEIKLQVSQLY